jgi:hypothetical protein
VPRLRRSRPDEEIQQLDPKQAERLDLEIWQRLEESLRSD